MADSKISQMSPKGGLDVYDLDQDFLPVAKNNGVDGNRKYSLRNIKEAVDALIPWNLTTTPDVLPVTAMPGSFLEVTVAGDYLTTTFEKFDLGIVSSDGVTVIRIPFLVASESFVLDTVAAAEKPQVIALACSDETTALTAGVAKVTFRMPYAFTLQAVRASLTTAQTSGALFTVDINESGVSVLSTLITIDNTEKTSTTAATPAVISDTALADDAEITIDIDQIGDGTAKGLKVYLIGVKA